MKTFLYIMLLVLAGMLNCAQAANTPSSTLHGKILYHGPIPPTKTQVIEQDVAACGETHKFQPVMVSNNGGLQQAVVSVEGVNRPSISLEENPLILRNEQCRFQPHISVGSVMQALEVKNSDPILHNTHIRTETRAFFNVVLLAQSKGFKKVMKKPGIMSISCNKHPFMTGYVHVFDHPYHASTNHQGAFTIQNLPAGTHTLSLWHETLGTMSKTFTIPQKNNTVLSIEFPAP